MFGKGVKENRREKGKVKEKGSRNQTTSSRKTILRSFPGHPIGQPRTEKVRIFAIGTMYFNPALLQIVALVMNAQFWSMGNLAARLMRLKIIRTDFSLFGKIRRRQDNYRRTLTLVLYQNFTMNKLQSMSLSIPYHSILRKVFRRVTMNLVQTMN